MPAALYMIAVRTLCRHLVKEVDRPGQLLAKLNIELATENPTGMFATLAHGLFDAATGHLLLASAGHPPPFLRRANGTVENVQFKSGRLLGYSQEMLTYPEFHVELASGDMLWFFTDGLLEARAGEGQGMFGLDRIRALVQECDASRLLAECGDAAKHAVERFTGSTELQDDLTLLMLRRKPSREA